MAKFRVWVSTNMIGSQTANIVELDEDDIEGMGEEEIWDAYLRDDALDQIEWGYERLPD